MKAISIWQPWASAIAEGHKLIETRHWPVSHRGEIAIHAARRWTGAELEYLQEFNERWPELALQPPLPLGAVVAVAEIKGCARTESLRGAISILEQELGNFTDGRYGWLLTNVCKLAEPVVCRGKQGLFDISGEPLDRVLAQLKGAA